ATIYGELNRLLVAEIEQGIACRAPLCLGATRKMMHATQRQHLRAVFAGSDMADCLALGADNRRFIANMPVGVDLHLDAAIGEDAFRHHGHEIDALDLLRNNEGRWLVVRVGGAGTDGGNEPATGVEQLAVPILLAVEGDARSATLGRVIQYGHRIHAHDAPVPVAIAIASAGATFSDVAHDGAGVAAYLFRDPLLARVMRFIPLGEFAYGRIHASRMAASMRDGVAGTLSTITPVAWRIALSMAGAVGISTCSPNPLAPNGPSGSGTSTSMVSMGGTSPMVGMR